MRTNRAVGRTLAFLLVAAVAATTVAPAPAVPEAGSPASTTDRGQEGVPTPDSVLGFPVGADFHLASYDESLEYFRRLAESTDRLRLVRVGETTSGLPWYLALIGSADNLDRLGRIREISRWLAHPSGLDDAEARRLAREGAAIVHIDAGLHATEVAHAQHAIQLAYDLVTGDDDPEIRAILDRVVLMLWFSINPDGQNMVVDWYESNLGTSFEVAPLPRLYQAYVGHDNNRDGYMLNMVESRVTTRTIREWEPQLLYNHHQTSPFPARIWIPPFAEPISTHVHPLMWRTINLVGMNMAHALEERGQEGAIHMGDPFDNWYPGYIDHANNFHNVASFLTETGLYRYATPHFYTVEDFPESKRSLRPESLYPSPWEGGWWRLGDAVDYMLTASMSVLDLAAKYKEDLLYNRYQAGRDVIRQHREEPPFAYFVPREQRDPVAPVELLRRLAFNGVRIAELTREVAFEGITHPAGTWVIPMDQEFAPFVRQLFAVQEYPELRPAPEVPPDQPFDVAGWTLPYQMDVRVVEARSPLPGELRSALRPVEGETVSPDGEGAAFDSVPGSGFDTHPVAAGVAPAPGRIRGSGDAVVLDPAQINAFRVLNRAWEEGGTVRFVPGDPDAEPGSATRSGRYLVSDVEVAILEGWIEELSVQAERASPVREAVRLDRPRIGVYRPWTPSIDEGWTRWLLERYGFEFSSLRNAEVRAGGLGERYDVVLLPDQRSSTIRDGFDPGTVPPRYAGGIGDVGVRALDHFVRDGGTLVALNRSSSFAIEALHLPVDDAVADLEREEFAVSGSVLEVEVDPVHPVMAGMPERAKVMVQRPPVFAVAEGFEGRALAAYPSAGSPLLSGYLLGADRIRGHAAALEVRHGEGRVVLLGFRPQWRGQPFGTFRILFQAALYAPEMASLAVGDPEFREPPLAEDEVREDEGEEGEPG